MKKPTKFTEIPAKVRPRSGSIPKSVSTKSVGVPTSTVLEEITFRSVAKFNVTNLEYSNSLMIRLKEIVGQLDSSYGLDVDTDETTKEGASIGIVGDMHKLAVKQSLSLTDMEKLISIIESKL